MKKLLVLVLVFSMIASFLVVTSGEVRAASTVIINPGNVISSNFLGVGSEYDPFNLMPEGLSIGYNDTYWELEKLRVSRMGLKIARVWFQADWFMTDWTTYDWNTAKMQAVYKFLDYLKSADIEVELEFGWKVSTNAQSWFAYPGSYNKDCGAPADLDAYATACSACINQLINVKGFTNIKYLTAYNEPNGSWDFEGPTDQKAYYLSMMQKIHNRLVADGRRSLVEIWGPEESGDTSWITYMANNGNEYFDRYSYHVYNATSYSSMQSITQDKLNAVSPTGKTVCMTEYGSNPNWTSSAYGIKLVDLFLAAANKGVKAILPWRLMQQALADPVNTDYAGGIDPWGALPWPVNSLNAKTTYYAFSLITRYVDRGSNVIYSSTADPEIHLGVFKNSSGEYTIIVNNTGTSAKSVTFDFSGTNISKTFGRHVYNASTTVDSNALVPQEDAVFSATTNFTDSAVPASSIVVYTTIPKLLQVKMTPLESNVQLGSTLQMSAQIIDGTGDVTWSVVGGAANGTIDASGLYTAPSTMPALDKILVKATSTSDTTKYGLAVITLAGAQSNVALNKTVTASSSVENWGWFKTKAVDGQRSSISGAMGFSSTNHATADSNEWLTIDLGNSSTVSKVDLYPRNDSGNVGKGFPVDFTIKVSSDNINWITVVTKTSYPMPGNSVQSFAFSPVTARYVKIDATKLGAVDSVYHLQFAEVEVYGSPDTSTPVSGLVSRWNFENNASDSAGLNNGVLTGGSYTAGKYGQAVSLNGTADKVTVASNSTLSLTNFSLSLWFKASSLPTGWSTLLEHGRGTANQYGIWKSDTNKVHFRWGNSSGTCTMNSSISLSANSWYHVVATYSNGTAKLYINNSLDSTVTNGVIPSAVNNGLTIGINNSNSEAFPGLIDDVRIYNYALNETEIANIYNGN